MLGVRLLELVATSKLSVQTGVIRQTGLLTILARQVHGGSSRRGMELQAVVDRLEQFAPTSLAGDWDNVGLLVCPTRPRPISTILLTNDLTEAVVDEAVQRQADLLISYHPPLFRPFKRLGRSSWKERVAVQCVEAGLAVYSPHTAWDAVEGGVNTWLCSGFPPGSAEPLQLVRARRHAGPSHSVLTGPSHWQQVTGEAELSSLLAGQQPPPPVLAHSLPPLPGTGPGRLLTLNTPATLQHCVDCTKELLGLDMVRLGLATGHLMDTKVRSIAVCAGAGASVVAGSKADLVLTGEMSHHEVLDLTQAGVSVLLADHSNTERGFLAIMQERLTTWLPGTTTLLSTEDREPLEIV